MRVLTPSGYVDVAHLQVGEQVCAFDMDTGAPITNPVEGIERYTPERFAYYEQDEDGNNIEPLIVPPFLNYVINGSYRVFHHQSIWNTDHSIVHGFELKVGDTIYDDADQLLTITSITTEPTTDWYRLKIGGDHSFIADGLTLHNASRFWVGGTANWDATNGTKWATTDGGAGGSAQPTATDDAFFTALSGAVTVTVSANNRAALGLMFTGFTGTFAGASSVNVTGSMTVGAGMTWTHNGTITFNATTTGNSITSNAKAITSALTFNGVGGGWTQADALSTTGQMTVTNGAFNDAGFTLTAGTISSTNSNTRSITKTGNWNISGTGVNILSFGSVTGLTFSDTAGAVNLTNATSGDRSINTGGLVWNDLKVSAGAGNVTVSGANAGGFRDVDWTGFTGTHIAGTINFRRNFTYSAGMTGTTAGAVVYVGTSGTGTLTNAGIARSGQVIINGVGGTLQLADALSTAQALTLTNGTFVDAGNPVTVTIFSSNNSNARTLTKTGNWTITGTGNVLVTNTTDNMTVTDSGSFTFSDSSAVARTANFGSIGTNPIAWGDVKVNAGTGDFTLVASVASVNHVDFTGYTGALQTANTRFRNDWKYGAGMTDIGTSALTYIGTSGICSFTSNGVTMKRNFQVAGAGGTVRLLDDMTSNGIISQTDGTFNYNNKNATIAGHTIAPASACALSLGSGTITLTSGPAGATTSVWTVPNTVTLTKGTATIKITDKGATTKTFNGGNGNSYPTVWNDTQGAGSILIFGGTGASCNYDVVKSSPGATFQIGANTTQTAADWQCSGTPGNVVTFQSGTPGTQARVACSNGGTAHLDYVAVYDSRATTENTFYAGSNSIDGGNNTNWIFQNEINVATGGQPPTKRHRRWRLPNSYVHLAPIYTPDDPKRKPRRKPLLPDEQPFNLPEEQPTPREMVDSLMQNLDAELEQAQSASDSFVREEVRRRRRAAAYLLLFS